MAERLKMIKSKSVLATMSLFVFAFANNAEALELSDLKKGIYLPKDVGCSGIGSAAQMYYDGSNISGHYQICKTMKIGNNKYKSTCLEAQGRDQPSLGDIDKSPDKEIFNLSINVKNNKSFVINNTEYNYCGDG